MNPADPNVGNVELVASALGTLREELVLVGGCAASLLIDAPSAPSPRVTHDVDLVATVTALSGYHRLERQFEQRGFIRDLSADAPICRWRLRGMIVDLMPTDERVLGFSNRWYSEAAASKLAYTLPSGNTINLISAPAFIATKFEAFRDRGRSDPLSSHDLEDIINVVEGCTMVIDSVRRAHPELKAYLRSRFAELVAVRDFQDLLPGLVAHDVLHAQRVAAVAARLTILASTELG